MNTFRFFESAFVATLLGVSAVTLTASGQDKPDAKVSIAAIDRAHDRGVEALERERLLKLANLAASQAAPEANATYETYFEHALNAHLYRDAEAAARQVLAKRKDASSEVLYLAEVTTILAAVDRGDFRAAVDELKAALAARQAQGDQGTANRLPLATKLTLGELFFQKLVQHDQFDLAREAFEAIEKNAADPIMREHATARLHRLALIGQPAPPIVGKDLDGKPQSLADHKGQVVFVVFWASWCMPNVREMPNFIRFEAENRSKGFRALGINLDTMQEGGQPLETVLPNIRRFVLDNNVPWPNLVNGTGDQDYAHAYAINEIPANVLIGRDGKIVALDLDLSNFRAEVEKALKASPSGTK